MAVDENVASSSSLESVSSPRASTTTSSAAIKIETTTLPFSDSPLLPPASANPKVAIPPRATLEYGKKKKKDKDKERALGVLEEDGATGGASSGLPIRRRKSGATVRKRSRTQEIAEAYAILSSEPDTDTAGPAPPTGGAGVHNTSQWAWPRSSTAPKWAITSHM